MSSFRVHTALFAFLDEIRAENSRKYFKSIRPLYDDILANVTQLCQHIIDYTGRSHVDDRPLTPRDCMFRIYRDARRLKDGDYIYKHNFGFFISPRGKKTTLSGYYIHLSPNKSMFASGMYHPAGIRLRQLRHQLAIHGNKYISLTQQSDFKERFGEVESKTLTRPPRGFHHYDHHMDLLRRRQHIIINYYADAQVLADYFLDEIKKDIDAAGPRSNRLNDAATTPLQ